MGISRVAVARALLQDALPNEVWYQPAVPGVDRSVMSPAEPWVPRQYGGWDTALGAAMGGWAFAAADYARLWASFDLGVHSPVMRPETAKIMWTNPWGYDGGTSQKSQVLRGWWRHRWQDAGGVPVTAIGHNGSFAGTAAVTWRRSDGISVVALFNRDVSLDFMGWSPFGSAMNAAIDQVHDHWPSHDLFPSVGLSSMCDDGWRRCQRCQTLHRLGGKAIDACPAGPPGHLDGGQATYTLVHNLPAARGHFGFRRCTKCQSLVHSTGSTAGRCAAGPGAQHDPAVGEYVLAKNEPATSPGQRGWRLCSRCQCVWYSDGSSRGVCPSSGAVGHTGQNGDDYLLLMY